MILNALGINKDSLSLALKSVFSDVDVKVGATDIFPGLGKMKDAKKHLKDLTKIQKTMHSMSLNPWDTWSNGMLTDNAVGKYIVQLQGLSAEEAKVVLNSSTLTAAQKKQVLSTYELTLATASLEGTENQLTVEQKEQLLTSGLIKEGQLERAISAGVLTVAEEGQIVATNNLTTAELTEQLVAAGIPPQSAAIIAAMLGEAGAKTTNTTATNLLTKAVLALTAAWNSNPIGLIVTIVVALAAAIAAVVVVATQLNNTIEKQRERFHKLKSELQDIVSELEPLQTELDSVRERMRELQGLGTLSFTEQEEYDNLVAQNAELERKIALLEYEKELKQQETAEAFIKTMNKDLHDKSEYHTTSDGHIDKGNAHASNLGNGFTAMAGGTVTTHYFEATEGEYVDSQFRRWQKYTDIVQQMNEEYASASADRRKEIDTYLPLYEESIRDIEKYFSTKQKEWNEDAEGLSYYVKPQNDFQREVNQWLDYIADMQDRRMIMAKGDNAKTNAFQRIVDNWRFDDVVQDLQDAGKLGQVTEDMLKSSQYQGFLDKLIELGVISSKDDLSLVAKMFNDIYKSANASNNAINQNVLSISKTIKNVNTKLRPAIDSLASAYQSIFSEDGGFTLETVNDEMLSSIQEAIAEINELVGIDIPTRNFEDFVKVLVDTESTEYEVHDAFDRLVSDIIEATDTAELSAENYDVLVQMLEELGVTNAEETLSQIKNVQDQLIAQGYDLTKMTSEQVLQFYKEANASGAAARYLEAYALQKALAENPLQTEDDVAALQHLVDELGLTEELMSEMGNIKQGAHWNELWKTYGQGAGEGAAKGLISKGKVGIEKLIKDWFDYEFDFNGLLTNKGDEDKEAMKEKFDWVERYISRIQERIEDLGNTISSAFQPFDVRHGALDDQLKELEKEQQAQHDAYFEYMAEANKVGLDETTITLIQDGKLEGGILDGYSEDEQEQIAEYEKWYDKALEAARRQKEVESDIVAKYQERFDLISSEYDVRTGLIEHEANSIDDLMKQMESSGYMISEAYYQGLIELENKNQKELRAKRKDLQSSFNEAVASGRIAEGSEEWYNLKNQILEVDEAIQDSVSSVIEFANSMEELEWAKFDKKQELISEIHDEKDFLLQLMDSQDKFDETGNWNEYAYASAGLSAMGYNTYMAQAKDNAAELAKLDEEYKDDKYNKRYLDQRKELLEAQRENILAAEDEKQAMIDLAKEGFDAMKESLDELIEKRKEALDAEKDLYDYQKSVADQTKQIISLEKQLAAYGGDDSEETQAKIQKIKVSLEDAKKNLEETEYDRWKQDQEQMLDKLSADTQEWIDERLENQEELMRGILDAVDGETGSIRSTLGSLANDVGTTLSSNMESMFGEGSMVARVETTLSSIGEDVAAMAKASLYNYTESDVDRLTKLVSNEIPEPTTLDYEKYDMNDDGSFSITDLIRLKHLTGYATGSRKIKKDELAWTQENGQELIYRPSDGAMLTPLEADGAVFTAEMTQRLWDIANNPEMFSNLTAVSLPKGMASYGNNNVQNDVVMNISLPNVVDVDGFVNELRTNKKFENIVQSMTLGNALGQNSLSKYRY